MSPEFRKGWRAAMQAAAKAMRREADSLGEPGQSLWRSLQSRADSLEEMPCPVTIRIVDGDGRKLL